MKTCDACEMGYDGHPAAHPEGCTCNYDGQRRSLTCSIVPIIEPRCPVHGDCAWVDCAIPGWHEHQVGDEWWTDDNGDVVTTYVHVRGLVLVSRNALAQLLEKAGYSQVEQPRALCDPLPPGEEPTPERRLCDPEDT